MASPALHSSMSALGAEDERDVDASDKIYCFHKRKACEDVTETGPCNRKHCFQTIDNLWVCDYKSCVHH